MLSHSFSFSRPLFSFKASFFAGKLIFKHKTITELKKVCMYGWTQQIENECSKEWKWIQYFSDCRCFCRFSFKLCCSVRLCKREMPINIIEVEVYFHIIVEKGWIIFRSVHLFNHLFIYVTVSPVMNWWRFQSTFPQIYLFQMTLEMALIHFYGGSV